MSIRFSLLFLFIALLSGCGGSGVHEAAAPTNVFSGRFGGSFQDEIQQHIATAVMTVDEEGAVSLTYQDGAAVANWSGTVGNSGQFTGAYDDGTGPVSSSGTFYLDNESTILGTVHVGAGSTVQEFRFTVTDMPML